MAKGKATPEPDKRQARQRDLALQEPRITVLTDQPLATGEAYRESFALDFRMGPILDIVRHQATRTPLAVAVYGTWGAGKTTAMKWLHALLDIWNKKREDKKAIRVTPVWFYPWRSVLRLAQGPVELQLRKRQMGNPSLNVPANVFTLLSASAHACGDAG